MEQASEVIYALRPVRFRYKPEIEPTRPLGFGLIAEDVGQVSPDLVTRGSDGQVNAVRYDTVNAMLLNEFLKEHRKIEEQEATIAELKADAGTQKTMISDLKKTLESVLARLEEED
jgi:Chaperone of endosialidase